ncbi:hypothetical protein, partial [Subdoligranulum variabile]
PFVKNFFEIFLKFFQEPKLPKSPQRLLLCGFSAAVAFALAPDSLTIIPPRTHFVNTFFQFF